MNFSKIGLRFVSAALLAPLIVGITLLGGWAVYGLAALALAVSLREWANLSHHGERIAWRRMALGVVYLFGAIAGLVYVREQLDGASLLLYILMAVWFSDSMAYLFGKAIGGPKLAPSISPNKTWAGLAGACVGAALGALLVVLVVPLMPSLPVSSFFQQGLLVHIAAGFAMGAVGQLGDLFISVFKRRAGVKDTGTLIPGHGGLLDRIDALLLVGFLAALVLVFIRGGA